MKSTIILMALLCSLANTTNAARVIGPWFRNYEGIEYAEGSDTSPRPQKVHALRISLKNPDVQLYTAAHAGSPPFETIRQTTQAYLDANDLKCAVNANFFDISTSPYTTDEGPLINQGVLVSGGGSWADQCLLFTEDKTPWLNQFDGDPSGWWTGVAGDVQMLIDGVPNDGWKHELDPRTAAGISEDGRYLILVVVDGSQPGYSEGVYWSELGQWCADFGCYNAVDLDGGGSSQMALRNVNSGAAQVMNSPAEVPDRAVGANLGVASEAMGTVGPAACSMNSNRIDMVSRGNGNYVYLRTWTSTTGWVSQGTIFGATTYDTPAICSRADGILDVFIRGTDNQLYQAHYQNGTWIPWTCLGGQLLSGPSTCSMNPTNWEVVYRGPNNNVWFLSWNTNVYNYGYFSGTTYDRPSIVSRGDGTKNIFLRGTDNCLWYNWYDGSTWHPFVSLGGTLTSGPATASRNVNNLETVYKGANNELWYLSWNNGTWSYGDLGGSLAGVPAICSLKNFNTASVYVRGSDDGWWEKEYGPATGWWAQFEYRDTYFY